MNIGDYQINITKHTTVTVEPFCLRARVQNRVGEREVFPKALHASHCVTQISQTPNNEKPSQVPGELRFLKRLKRRAHAHR